MEYDINLAYNKTLKLAKSHYENFPVVSLFVPVELRKHVAVFYTFARKADDIADEGNKTDAERLIDLEMFERELTKAINGEFVNEFWFALQNTIVEKKLSTKYFYQLIDAFKQDLTKKRYKNFEEVTDYCRRSANPVGRIILELNNIRDEQANKYSDNICTALQLTNFYQDVMIDWEKGRIYIPFDEMDKFRIYEKTFEMKENSSNFKKLLKYQINRTRELFTEGRNLLNYLPPRLKFQIRWTILGGEKILEKIETIDCNVLNVRPKLNKKEYFSLMIKSLF